MLTKLLEWIGMDTLVRIEVVKGEETCFYYGGIMLQDTYRLILAAINEYGEYDGYVAIKKQDIIQVSRGSEELRKRYLLYRGKQQSHLIVGEHANDPLLTLLQFAKEKGLMVRVVRGSNFESVCGMISAITNDDVLLTVVDPNGKINGETNWSSHAISILSCDTAEEQDRRLLYRSLYPNKESKIETPTTTQEAE